MLLDLNGDLHERTSLFQAADEGAAREAAHADTKAFMQGTGPYAPMAADLDAAYPKPWTASILSVYAIYIPELENGVEAFMRQFPAGTTADEVRRLLADRPATARRWRSRH